MTVRRSERGFSLLEVLIAMLVMALGLLGMAGLLIRSFSLPNDNYWRNQATTFANTVAADIRLICADGRCKESGGILKSMSDFCSPKNLPVKADQCLLDKGQLVCRDYQDWSFFQQQDWCHRVGEMGLGGLPQGELKVEATSSTSPVTYLVTLRWQHKRQTDVGAEKSAFQMWVAL